MIVGIPAAAGVCAFDIDECTVTLALDKADDVWALVNSLPAKNRVMVCSKAAKKPGDRPGTVF